MEDSEKTESKPTESVELPTKMNGEKEADHGGEKKQKHDAGEKTAVKDAEVAKTIIHSDSLEVEESFFKGFAAFPDETFRKLSDQLKKKEKLVIEIKEKLDSEREKLAKGRKRKAEDENANEEDRQQRNTTQTAESEAKFSKDDSAFPELPLKQDLGKGKRARIPNKRYSDIMLSPHNRSKHPTENGTVEKLDVIKTDTLSSNVSSVRNKPKDVSSKESPQPQRPKTYNLSDPKYLKPFEYGWRRELVYRQIQGPGSKRMGDIYYYTPTGKKVRSMRELSENLNSKHLTLDNFTYTKEPLGIEDTEKEIIRDAKIIRSSSDAESSGSETKVLSPNLKSSTPIIKKVTKNTPVKAIQKTPQSPKIVSTPVAIPSTSTASPKVASPRLAGPKGGSISTNAGIETADSASTSSTETSMGRRSSKRAIVAPNVRLPLKKEKKSTTKSDEDLQNEGIPMKTPVNKKGRWSKSPAASPATPKAKKRTLKISKSSDEKEEKKFMEHFLQNMAYGYNTLLYVFQYLKVQDLLRAGCVCTMWRDLASHPMLWQTVRMKNSQVHSFEGLANTLKKHGTRHLDLRKMLLPTGGDEIWPEFSEAIGKVDTLRKIELCRCPASVVEKLAVSNPQLEVINAVTIKCESMDLEPLKALKNIQELRIKSTSGLTLTSNIDSLKEMKQLRHLSLTSIRDLDGMSLSVIAELTSLESLDLGECTDFPKNFGSEILIKLMKLEKLRLEKGQGNCHTFEILEAVKNMCRLEQLELVNFDIKAGFDKALGACHNIRKLLIIPTYISQSATTNHMVLGGVLRLQKTLSHFVWGVTLELLRVTELFVDQCEEPKKEKRTTGNGDCIPVLKPVPLLTDKSGGEIPPAHDPPQVEILALPSLQKLLMQNLPTTRVKILKIPFHATWRQSITDSVN